MTGASDGILFGPATKRFDAVTDWRIRRRMAYKTVYAQVFEAKLMRDASLRTIAEKCLNGLSIVETPFNWGSQTSWLST